MKDTKRTATVKELSAIIDDLMPPGIGETAIRKHIARKNIQPVKRGLFPVDKVLEAIKEGRAGKYTPDVAGLLTGRDKKIELECTLLQAKIDEVRRLTMPVAECRDMLLLHMNIVKRTIQHLPKDISSIISDPEAIRAVDDKCIELLNNLSEECSRYDRSRA